ncbi:helix-turn-helix domain-containing protein [Neptunicella marina]|uniref:AraC family transcriptional regulator n=1 Tax=Neptunicella marina TaxID=2125989 RepID=A0A8J6IU74_9ALTE|nr:helix-turn-helix domain-containing protein [Neptunicella marina]MBC3765523.1 AraC family transcriptional regulator [Neptunicella marina]
MFLHSLLSHMDAVSTFFYTFAIAQMLLSALSLGINRQRSQLTYLYTGLMLAASCYLLGYIASGHQSVLSQVVAFIGGNCVLGLFWLVSLCLFSDHIKVNYKHYVIASVPLILPTLVKLWLAVGSPPPNIQTLIANTALLVELSLICHALGVTIRYWRDDLIEQRRLLRASLICFGGIYLFLVIFVEQVLNFHGEWLSQIESITLAALSLFLNTLLLRLREASLFASRLAQAKTSLRHKQSPEVERILSAMSQDLLYQQEGITIAELAKKLNMYEYKLRNVINGELGYRNFNDFLNYYRINEVTAKLNDPGYSSVAILNLALDSGFRSLSSFNKAFKNTHHVTPSEYRKRCIGQE